MVSPKKDGTSGHSPTKDMTLGMCPNRTPSVPFGSNPTSQMAPSEGTPRLRCIEASFTKELIASSCRRLTKTPQASQLHHPQRVKSSGSFFLNQRNTRASCASACVRLRGYPFKLDKQLKGQPLVGQCWSPAFETQRTTWTLDPQTLTAQCSNMPPLQIKMEPQHPSCLENSLFKGPPFWWNPC